MPPYINNPQIRRTHEKAKAAGLGASEHGESGTSHGEGGGAHPHSISIHHAAAGQPHASNAHHVHVHHADGSHEHSEHGNFQEAMDHAQSKASGDGSPMDGGQAEPVEGEMPDGY